MKHLKEFDMISFNENFLSDFGKQIKYSIKNFRLNVLPMLGLSSLCSEDELKILTAWNEYQKWNYDKYLSTEKNIENFKIKYPDLFKED